MEMHGYACVLFIIAFIGRSQATSLADNRVVPLAVLTSNAVEFAPTKIGSKVSADFLSQTTIAAISEHVTKVVAISMPKLSYPRLVYDANYNNQQNTQFLAHALESMNSVLYPAVSDISHLKFSQTPVIVQLKSSGDLKDSDITTGRFVQLKLGSSISLHDADVILGHVIKTLNETGQSFSVIYTAEEPDSWISGIPKSEEASAELANTKDEVLQRYKRQAKPKQAKPAATVRASVNADATNFTLFQYADSCFQLFAKEITLSMTNTSAKTSAFLKLPYVYRPSESTDFNCTAGKDRDPFNFTISYKGLQDNFTDLSINYAVKMKNPWEWIVDNITIDYNAPNIGSGTIKLKPTWLTAQLLFSYHCNTPDKTVNLRDPKDDKYKDFVVVLSFDTIQAQAFDVRNNAFGWQCDCVGFFTSAIWAGLIVSIIYLLIIALALVMLMNLETMDRFEDPKGQPLKIQASG